MEPAREVADLYLKHKGYGVVEPRDVVKLEGQSCWYFYYLLPDGNLELEVSWDANAHEWDTLVTGFQVAV